MSQLTGFKTTGDEGYLICRLKQSLSSLKQVLRMWYHQFDSYIQQLGYNWSDSDLCMHIRQLADKSWIYMILYVDDMLIAESDEAEIKKLNG